VIALMFLSYLFRGSPWPLSARIYGVDHPGNDDPDLPGQKSMIKALMMAAFGFLLAYVGIDMLTGRTRFTYGLSGLVDGIGILPIAMGLFGVAEVLENMDASGQISIFKTKLGNFYPTRQDWKDSWKPITRGSIIGFFIGIIPGEMRRLPPLCPTPRKSVVPGTLKGLVTEPSKVWQALNPRTMLLSQVAWCRSLPWEFQPVWPARSCLRPS